jgi:hypothetical protein
MEIGLLGALLVTHDGAEVDVRGARLVGWLQDIFPETAEALGVGGRPARLAYAILRKLRNKSLEAAVMCVVLRGSEPHMLNEREPETRMAYLPKGTYRILDTWHVGGLRGTGSHDIVVEDVFVSAERTFSFTDSLQDDRPRELLQERIELGDVAVMIVAFFAMLASIRSHSSRNSLNCCSVSRSSAS